MRGTGCARTEVMTNGIPDGDEGRSSVSNENDLPKLRPEKTPLVTQEPDPHVGDFLLFLEEEFAPHKLKFQTLVNQSNIRFEYLWRLFPVGSDITFHHTETGLICAGKVNTQTN